MKKFFIATAIVIISGINFTGFAKDLKQNSLASEASITNYPRGSAWVNVPGHGLTLIEFYSFTIDGDITGARFDDGMWICEGTITEVNGDNYVDVYIDGSSLGSFAYQGFIYN